MPLYMDRHEVAGTSAEDMATGHIRDLEVQEKYGVRYLTYWLDIQAGRAFCLVESPSKEAAEAVHREAHGLVATDIIEVDKRVVEEFLGKIEETPAALDPGMPVSEGGLRTILFTDMQGSTNLTQRLGDAKAMELLRAHNAIIRDALAALGGREVKHTGDGIMASFASVAAAVECAIAIQRSFLSHTEQNPGAPIRVRIGLSAGEPVTEGYDLFGAAVQLAARICDCSAPEQILVSNAVRELAIGKGFLFADRGEVELKGFEDAFRLHEVRWRG